MLGKCTWDEGINIDYCYSLMSGKDGQADIVIRVEDNEKAAEILGRKNIKLITDSDI